MNSSKLLTRISFAVALAASAWAAAASSGCLAVVAGAGAAGAVAYVRGELDTTLDAGFGRTVRAANQAVSTLEFAKVSERHDAMLDVIIARNADDKKIEIRVERTSDSLTRVKIRVGVFGDEALSLVILDKLKAAL